MSVPSCANSRQSSTVSHCSPPVVTPLICAAILAGSVLPANCAANALITTASYASPA